MGGWEVLEHLLHGYKKMYVQGLSLLRLFKSVPIKTCRFLSYLLQWIMINQLEVGVPKMRDSVKEKVTVYIVTAPNMNHFIS